MEFRELWPEPYNRKPVLVDLEDYDKVKNLSLPVTISWDRLRYLYKKILGHVPEGHVVDHINGDVLDNRKANLRICKPEENQRNKRPISGTSLFKGVTRDRSAWRARLSTNGIVRSKNCKTELEAAKAYDDMVRAAYPDCPFSYLNFPDGVAL